jgi:hypothetical protein
MGSFVDFAEMKAHCSVEHGLLEDSLPPSGSQVRVESWFNLDATWTVMRWTGWHVSFVPSAEVTAFIQSPHRPAKPGRHRGAALTLTLSNIAHNEISIGRRI